MFWKKKKSPTDSATPHFEGLFGLRVAGLAPETSAGASGKIDLETELFSRNNQTIAKLVIIAGLLKNDDRLRTEVLRLVEPASIGEKSFEGYVFSLIRESLEDNARVSLSKVGEQIAAYESKVMGQAPTRRSLEGYYYKWAQILSLEPTQAEVQKAIEIIRADTEEKVEKDKSESEA